MRLLVVEDDVKMVSLLKRGLEREGYAVDIDHWQGRVVGLATEHHEHRAERVGIRPKLPRVPF